MGSRFPEAVPGRQPCSALCRMASLGPLLQTEIMAGFPEKVSDWTVIYFYPRHKTHLGYSEKPINDIQFLIICLLSRCVTSVTLPGSPVKGKFRKAELYLL